MQHMMLIVFTNVAFFQHFFANHFSFRLRVARDRPSWPSHQPVSTSLQVLFVSQTRSPQYWPSKIRRRSPGDSTKLLYQWRATIWRWQGARQQLEAGWVASSHYCRDLFYNSKSPCWLDHPMDRGFPRTTARSFYSRPVYAWCSSVQLSDAHTNAHTFVEPKLV